MENLNNLIIDAFIANYDKDLYQMNATITSNRQIAFITKQFIWMEIYTQQLFMEK